MKILIHNFNLISIYKFFFIINLFYCKTIMISSYSKVSRVGSVSTDVEATISTTENNLDSKIINVESNNSKTVHNPGREGIFNEYQIDKNLTSNSTSENEEYSEISNESFTAEDSSGRSYSDRRPFPFPLSLDAAAKRRQQTVRRQPVGKAVYNSNYNTPQYVYPVPALKNKASAMDRFSPSEAYAFTMYKPKNKKPGYDYTPPKAPVMASPAIMSSLPVIQVPPQQPLMAPPGPVYKPPKDLYNFPPNTNSKYRPPSLTASFKEPVTSYIPSAAGSQPSMEESQPPGPVYKPPADLHNFPPNINSNYHTPPIGASFKGPVTSYIPPAAGSADHSDSNSFLGPVNPKYLPASEPDNEYLPAQSNENSSDSDHDNHDHPPTMNDNSEIEYLPPSDEDYNHYPDHTNDHLPTAPIMSMNTLKMSAKPTAPVTSGPPTENPMAQMMMAFMQSLKQNNENSHNHDHPPAAPSLSDHLAPDHDHDHPTFSFPPDHDHEDMGPGDDHDDMMPDHNHDHPPDHYSGQYGVDAYPEVIYDHDPHEHHDHPPPETTTTTTPPPEPMQPRVKQYSYFYIGRKLWYVPLYFTLYFTFYVAGLIIKSISRHKVDLPNHWSTRSIRDLSHKELTNKIERLTNFVMSQIDEFKDKHI